ncbi:MULTISPECIES: sigma-54 dependent transcriptional regulator [unclassified Variovorax]|uniref:sigma-54 interaction domain-containing protein n=1 Tax=unclassified Variovorax TaxID=663243 RepID=UPI002577012D|nr:MULTISPECIES: sigma-54 dependent transcriptional regulator [unclassified Variovorax]MDM0087166.1 sigma-54 dependent transcriptional regulator [Variovorax sp. J22G40]MDM0144577.1 sigma-54 dependent transcriptional regulator [Variovorax sp. J2P1-31]
MDLNEAPLRLHEPDPPHTRSASAGKTLILRDPRSAALLLQLERVARSEATVVIVGETGTGKELAARHLHAASGRRGPFVAVNCGAFSDTLIDAELFGHEAGAFTGAPGARPGWFEAANGGTLFLDEIGELPLPMQVKLLRVLQERQVVRIGSRRPIAIDVRLVTATHVDLERAVEAERFRADLYYRLNVAPLHLPPLRARTGDILPLANHFIARCAERTGRDQVRLAPDAEAVLLAHAWPGNVRELENAIEFAWILSRGRPIAARDLQLMPVLAPDAEPAGTATPAKRAEGEAEALAAAVAATAEGPGPVAGMPPELTAPLYQELAGFFDRLIARGDPALFQSVEEVLVRAAYARCGENQVQTARTLDITRNMLRTLLKRYGLLGSGELLFDEDTPPVSRTPLRFPAVRRDGTPHGRCRPCTPPAACNEAR